jgi:hypothetical protein
MAATLWVAAIGLTPLARGQAASPGLRGVATVFDTACGRLCHQRSDRSWSTDGVRWPVCARCAGLYAGAVAGAWLALAVARQRHDPGPGAIRAESLRVWLLIVAAPTLATWAIERAGWLGFSNAARFWLALPPGAIAAGILVSMITGRID